MEIIKRICNIKGIILVAGLLCLVLTGLAKGETKVVVAAIDSDVRHGLDPVSTNDRTTDLVLRHLYDSLFFRDRNNKLVPLLAEKYEMVNPLTWRIGLKKGIRFQNGEPFTADSVKYSLDYILDPSNKSMYISYINRIDRIKIIDDYMVEISTKQPFPTLLGNFTDIGMAPSKLAREKGMSYINEHPVGTGPYKLESWLRDREIRLIRDDKYWLGVPKYEKLIFRIIPDLSARVSALMAGEIHLMEQIPFHLIKQINSSGTAAVKGIAGRRVVFLSFDNINSKPLSDVRVRQALNYGVNVQEIINKLMEGRATQIAGPLIPINNDCDPLLKPYPYDPEKAKKLLKEAGYGSGLNLTYHSSQGRYAKDKEFAEAIALQLAKIGVNVTVKFHEWISFTKLWSTHKAYDMHVMSRQDRELDGAVMYPFLACNETAVTFCDPELDKKILAATAILDPTKRTEAFKKLQKEVHDLAPWLFLWQQHELYGVSKDLNWEPRPDGNFFFHDYLVK